MSCELTRARNIQDNKIVIHERTPDAVETRRCFLIVLNILYRGDWNRQEHSVGRLEGELGKHV